MSNSIFKDFMLLAAGGIVGLIASEVLRTDDEDDEEEDYDDTSEPLTASNRSVEALFESLNTEVQAAIDSCKTDEARAAVRESIQQSIQQLQNDLTKCSTQAAKKTEAPTEANSFVNLEDGTMPKPEESFSKQHVQNVQHLFSKLSEILTQAVENPSVANHPSTAAPACAS